jgi:hypothetical protein
MYKMYRNNQLRTAIESLLNDAEVSAHQFVDVFLGDLHDKKTYHQEMINKIDKVLDDLKTNEGKKKQVIKADGYGYHIDYDPLDLIGEDPLNLGKVK